VSALLGRFGADPQDSADSAESAQISRTPVGSGDSQARGRLTLRKLSEMAPG